ncbi:MAG: hypothetical protein ACRDOT_04390 [Aeromicrobium sp.]
MSSAGRLPRADARFVIGAVAALLLLYVPALLVPLLPDEAGYWLVARAWDPQPDNMFGFYWADRTPVLIWMFQAADVLGGPFVPRVFSAMLAALMVVAVFRAARIVAGAAAARWSTATTVILLSNPAWYAWTAKSESFGVPLVMVSCWLALEGLDRRPGWARLAVVAGAGTAGMLAVGMKQNLAGGLVFGAVLLVTSLLRRDLRPRLAAMLACVGLAGAMVPVVGLLIWAEINGVRTVSMWEMIYGFRSDAFDVITRGHASAPLSRVRDLLLLFVATGLGVLIALLLVSLRRTLTVRPAVTAAVLAMLAVDVAGIALGGSYWTPYLVTLVPAAVLGVALILVSGSLVPLLKASVVFAAVSSAMMLAYFGYTHLTGRSESTHATYIGEAVSQAAHPDDTILVLYGVPEVVRASGLNSPYPYLWSLPVRTLDPELALLRATVEGDDAPEWVVQKGRLNAWGLDDRHQLRDLLRSRYVVSGRVCGSRVWRLEAAQRPALPRVDCGLPWLSYAGR